MSKIAEIIIKILSRFEIPISSSHLILFSFLIVVISIKTLFCACWINYLFLWFFSLIWLFPFVMGFKVYYKTKKLGIEGFNKYAVEPARKIDLISFNQQLKISFFLLSLFWILVSVWVYDISIHWLKNDGSRLLFIITWIFYFREAIRSFLILPAIVLNSLSGKNFFIFNFDNPKKLKMAMLVSFLVIIFNWLFIGYAFLMEFFLAYSVGSWMLDRKQEKLVIKNVSE